MDGKKWIINILRILCVVVFMGVFLISFAESAGMFGQWGFGNPKTMTEKEKKQYANVVLMPELSNCLERYSTMRIHTGEFKYAMRVSMETYSYGSVEEMCNALPEGCREAILATLEKAKYEDTDLADKRMKYYVVYSDLGYMSEENGKLPLVSELDIDQEYQELERKITEICYQVLEYEDGSYRFHIWYEYLLCNLETVNE